MYKALFEANYNYRLKTYVTKRHFLNTPIVKKTSKHFLRFCIIAAVTKNVATCAHMQKYIYKVFAFDFLLN